jgi:hypothetical protein
MCLTKQTTNRLQKLKVDFSNKEKMNREKGMRPGMVVVIMFQQKVHCQRRTVL